MDNQTCKYCGRDHLPPHSKLGDDIFIILVNNVSELTQWIHWHKEHTQGLPRTACSNGNCRIYNLEFLKKFQDLLNEIKPHRS